MSISDSVVENIGKVLNDPQRPMKERFRALFTLRNLGGGIAIKCISECFKDESVLLKHELAYCLGQMQDERAIPILRDILEDKNEDPIVRHEAGEALGAIGEPNLRELLEKYQHDPAIEVAETCQIALQRLNWVATECAKDKVSSKYASIDPAPPSTEDDVEHLKQVLMDENKPLFERYRAMFSLRNLGTMESINALGEGFKASSALFRHEVAFIFGQMQDERSVPFLKRTLEDTNEHEMVRHEAAEALGSIATDECTEVLKSNRVLLRWVPGHAGIVGNERADELARKGAGSIQMGPEPICGIPKSLIKLTLKTHCFYETLQLWKNAPGLEHSKALLKAYSKKCSSEALKLNRNNLRILVRISDGN